MQIHKLAFGLISILIVMCCATRTSCAHVIEELPGDMVYATPEEQEYLYNLIQEKGTKINYILKEEGVKILKESITPVYDFDVLKYAATGKLVLNAVMQNSEGEKFRIYYAKTITANGMFGGTLKFFVWEEDKEVGGSMVSWLPTSSYADHARRIQTIMGTESVVSPSDVRLICASGVPEAFYVRVGEEERIVFMGRLGKWASDEFQSSEKKSSYSIKEFERAAVEYKKEWDRREEETKALLESYPGAEIIIGGTVVDFGLEYYTNDDEVDNINNIAEYLGIDMTSMRETNTSGPNTWMTCLMWIGGVSIALLACGATLFVLLRKEKRANLGGMV